jgi:rhodanese-related sulfurtransferase
MSHYDFKQKNPNPNYDDVTDVESTEVWENKDELVLVDVRREDEYYGELGHVAGSQWILLDTLPEKLDTLPKDKTIVFICRSGGRSAQATHHAKNNGFTEVYNMRGGMLDWNLKELLTEGKNGN